MKVPIASALTETRAMAASPFILVERLSRKIKNETRTTIGRAIESGARPRTEAIAKAPKATWESPSLNMELRRSTNGAPTSAAEIEMSKPATKALTMNE